MILNYHVFMDANISKSKIILAIISLVITFLVWQQGLRESLDRPSVSFDITQKENEITELALPAIPQDLRKFFVLNDPGENIRQALSKSSFDELSDRNKLIWLVGINKNEDINLEYYDKFTLKKFKVAADNLRKNNLDSSYIASSNFLKDYKFDKYINHILINKFHFEEKNNEIKFTARKMFLKIIIIKLIPLLSIFLGSALVLKFIWKIFNQKKIIWSQYIPLELNLLDMVLLISGGFVVLGEVFSPLISISLVDTFSKGLNTEISQSLKIIFGYLSMSIPPLYILYRQIKFIDKDFTFKKDYFQFNYKPIKEAFVNGFKGWLMIIPFVLLTSLIMNFFINNDKGSNPLLEIVLNNNNYFALIVLFITTTVVAPFFEEVIFRGVLLPILARDLGVYVGIILSSFVFALAHLSFGELPPLFVLGIGLAMTRLISGRLLSSIIMHSLWNGLTFLNLFLLRT